MSGQVYFVRQIGGVGPVKIGFTKNLKSRLRAIQTYHPHPLEVLMTFDGSQNDEAVIHRSLSHLRLSGEWFSVDEQVEKLIEYVGKHLKLPSDFSQFDTKAKALQMFSSGMGFSEISDALGVSRQRVHQIVSIDRYAPEPVSRPKVTNHTTDQIEQAALSARVALADVFKHAGIPGSTFYRARKRGRQLRPLTAAKLMDAIKALGV